SAIVLLDDDFGSIVSAIRLGRRIYDNLRKAMAFIFAVHVPIAGLALLPLALGLPLIFSPVHIAFLELIIDPVCSLVFEAEREEHDVMNRPPRQADSPLFTWALIGWSVLQGTLVFALVAVVFVLALRSGMPTDESRALAFFSLVVSIFGLVLVNRSFSASFWSEFCADLGFTCGHACSGYHAALAFSIHPISVRSTTPGRSDAHARRGVSSAGGARNAETFLGRATA